MTNRSWMALGICLLFLTTSSCEPAADDGMSLEVMSEKVYDAPVKTQVTLDTVAPSLADIDAVKDALHAQFRRTASRRGFKYRRHPDSIWIRVFKERSDASDPRAWALLLEWREGMSEPTVHVRKPVAVKEIAGLTVDKQKKIFKQRAAIERRVDDEGFRKFPNNTKKQDEYINRETKGALRDLAEQNNITRKQLDAISGQGIRAGWPSR